MGFFATFWTWLNGQLASYIGTNTALLASALEPTVVMLATLYVMAWGYLHLMGKIDEPVLTGVKRILALGLILGVSLQLWLYNTVIVDTFYNAPAQLAAAIVGSSDPVSTIDTIWESGGAVGGNLWSKGGLVNGNFGFYIAGVIVWCLMGLLCVYAMFLIALSSIALAVLLALGPLFVAMLATRSPTVSRWGRGQGRSSLRCRRLRHGCRDRKASRTVPPARAGSRCTLAWTLRRMSARSSNACAAT